MTKHDRRDSSRLIKTAQNGRPSGWDGRLRGGSEMSSSVAAAATAAAL